MDLRTHFDDFTRRDWRTTTDEGPLRVAMVGIGWWTLEKAMPAVEASELCTTTVAVSSSTEKAMGVVEEHETVERGITYEALDDGAATDAYDAVYICTPNSHHRSAVESAARHGKAILCEKPMAATVKDARAIVEAGEDADVPLMIAYRMQTEPAVRRARDLVSEGFVGDPITVHGHMTQPLLEMNPDPHQWRLDPDRSGGATLNDLGIYPLNTARFVLDADPVAVQSAMDARQDAFADVPDEHVAFLVEFDNGAYASCSASQGAARSSSLRVIGTEGELEIDPAFYPRQPRTLSLARGEVRASHDFDQIDQMEEEFDYFADRVLSGEPIHPDGRHGLVDMETIEATYRAAEEGRRISLG